MAKSFYVAVEHFKDPVLVYKRFQEHGRLMPEGLNYVASWVSHDYSTCFQLMETSKRPLIDQWIAKWEDLVDFEIFPVMSSKEAADKLAPKLKRD